MGLAPRICSGALDSNGRPPQLSASPTAHPKSGLVQVGDRRLSELMPSWVDSLTHTGRSGQCMCCSRPESALPFWSYAFPTHQAKSTVEKHVQARILTLFL